MVANARRVAPGPGQESVWDYPRPPRVEPVDKRIRIVVGGEVVADTTRARRVLETSHPPVYYLPPDDIRMELLQRNDRRSFCEFKGEATYLTLRVGDRVLEDVAWSYAAPSAGFDSIADHVAFYPAPLDEVTVDGEPVTPQPGGFYGGWITADIVGPFKGGPGTWGW